MDLERPPSRSPTAAAVLRRAPRRFALGIWRHRGQVLLGGVVALAIGAYELAAGPQLGNGVQVAGVQTGGDCADTVMSAVSSQTPSSARSAYRCMSTNLRGQLTEDEFVSQVSAAAGPASSASDAHPTRVGEHRDPDGSRIVYFALDARGQSVGYIIYLGPDGKVQKME
jgi:hypothetical protein